MHAQTCCNLPSIYFFLNKFRCPVSLKHRVAGSLAITRALGDGYLKIRELRSAPSTLKISKHAVNSKLLFFFTPLSSAVSQKVLLRTRSMYLTSHASQRLHIRSSPPATKRSFWHQVVTSSLDCTLTFDAFVHLWIAPPCISIAVRRWAVELYERGRGFGHRCWLRGHC